ncbi:hypothetical protein ACU5AX_00085 [Sphingomonas sp. XXL09]|uniref:hypothetical protein n=1 Tax=Sphingomonas sp. XXL09 TaxID=3457787 RepID=UPI00406BA020
MDRSAEIGDEEAASVGVERQPDGLVETGGEDDVPRQPVGGDVSPVDAVPAGCRIAAIGPVELAPRRIDLQIDRLGQMIEQQRDIIPASLLIICPVG